MNPNSDQDSGGALSSPLRDLIRRAQQNPGSGVAAAARQKENETTILRAERLNRSTKGVRVLVCDYSGSMNDLVVGSRKFDHLLMAVRDCGKTYPGVKLVAFSSTAALVDSAADIPDPSHRGGSTDLAAGLRTAAELHPERTVVITDGYPNSRPDALQVAEKMSGVIDVVYCGHDTDRDAITFMQELAACGCGRQVSWDAGRLELSEAVGMLMLGAPGGVK